MLIHSEQMDFKPKIKTDYLLSAAKHSSQVFGVIYEKYFHKIYQYFWYRSGQNTPEAEDLTQETFLRAFKQLPEFEDKGIPYSSYLFTIAHNLLVNFYRKPKHMKLNPELEIPDNTPHRQIETNLEVTNLWKAVKSLNKSEQHALLLHYRDDLPIKEIAEKMKKSENAVKLLLSRGRKKLSNHPALRK